VSATIDGRAGVVGFILARGDSHRSFDPNTFVEISMRRQSILVVLSLAVAIAAPAHAQLSTPAAPPSDSTVVIPRAVETRAEPVAPATETAGAPTTGLRAGVHARDSHQPAAPTAASHANLGQARAMMVVGVAGLIVGAIIGGTPGTLIMVGGALVGLKGLYDYMQ
jgi:hypothetical protein